MRKAQLLIVLFLLSTAVYAQQKTGAKFGKGMYNVVAEDGSWSLKMGLRIQSLFVGKWDVSDSLGIQAKSSQFLVRRARLKFGGFAFTPKLQYKIELGLSNRDLGKASEYTNQAPKMILDAVVKWNFYKNFTLWAGQTKLPGNRERVISSANMQLVDRSLLNKEFNIDQGNRIKISNVLIWLINVDFNSSAFRNTKSKNAHTC